MFYANKIGKVLVLMPLTDAEKCARLVEILDPENNPHFDPDPSKPETVAVWSHYVTDRTARMREVLGVPMTNGHPKQA